MKKLIFTILLSTKLALFAQVLPEPFPPIILTDTQLKTDSLIKEYSLDKQGLIAAGYCSEQIPQGEFNQLNLPNDQALFNIASVTKTLTGFAILQLIQDNLLKPTDSIGQFLDGFCDDIAGVTIEELAFHTNGIHDYFSIIDDHQGINNPQVLYELKKLDSTVFEPGTYWGYTNSGYVLLAEIIERVSGETYLDYLRKSILEPYGLAGATHSSVAHHNTLKGHSQNGDLDSVITLTFGGGNFYFTHLDMKTLGQQMIFNQDLNSLIELGIKLSKPWKLDSSWNTGYGMWVSEDEFGKFIAHSGRSFGSVAYYRYYYEKRFFLYYMTNQDPINIKEFRTSLIQILLEP